MSCNESDLQTIEFKAGDTVRLTLETEDDLTGYSTAAEVRDKGGNLVTAFATAIVLNSTTNLMGNISLELTSTQTTPMSVGVGNYFFDIKFWSGSYVQRTDTVAIRITGKAVTV